MGPTALQPRRHAHCEVSHPDAALATEEEERLTVPAGSVALVSFDAWHRAAANTSESQRYMLKQAPPSHRPSDRTSRG